MARRESAAGPGSRALIVDLIRSSGPISRVELVNATGLTQPTISNIVRRLIDDGVVRETGATVATGGKPRTLLVINSHALYGVGIHVAADGLTCVVTDTRGGTVGRQLVASLPDGAPERVVAHLVALYRDVTHSLGLPMDGVAGLAVVGPGPVDVVGGRFVALPGLRRWSDLDLAAALTGHLGVPVLVDSDAGAAAIGEFWGRQVSRQRTFGCLYMNSGLGSGVVLDGALHRGATSNAGRIGHTTAVVDGLPCACGNRGCLEQYVAPPALVSRARSTAGLSGRLGISAEDPDSRAFDVLARAAIYGDKQARALIDESAALLAEGAVTLANLWDLDALVLAGPGFAVAGSIYVSEIRRRLTERAFSREIHGVQVDLSSNPRDSAAIGGAALVLQASVAPGHGPQVVATPGMGRQVRPFPAPVLT